MAEIGDDIRTIRWIKPYDVTIRWIKPYDVPAAGAPLLGDFRVELELVIVSTACKSGMGGWRH